MVILETDHDFRSPVVTTLHVEEARREVLATCTEVDDFNSLVPIIRKENILRLHVAVDNTRVLHELESLAHLVGDTLQLLLSEDSFSPSEVGLHVLVKVGSEALEHDDDVLAKLEVVVHLNDAVSALVVHIIPFLQLIQDFDLDVGVVHIELPIFAYLDCNHSMILIFHVLAPDHSPKGASVYPGDNLVSVSQLLALLYHVVSFLVSHRVLVHPPGLPNGIYTLKHSYLDLLEFCEVLTVHLQGFVRGVAIPGLAGVPVDGSHCALAARRLGVCTLAPLEVLGGA